MLLSRGTCRELLLAGWHGGVCSHGLVMPGWKWVCSQQHGGRQRCPRQQLSPNCSRRGRENMAMAHIIIHQRNITKDCPSSYQLLPRPAPLGRAGMLGVELAALRARLLTAVSSKKLLIAKYEMRGWRAAAVGQSALAERGKSALLSLSISPTSCNLSPHNLAQSHS